VLPRLPGWFKGPYFKKEGKGRERERMEGEGKREGKGGREVDGVRHFAVHKPHSAWFYPLFRELYWHIDSEYFVSSSCRWPQSLDLWVDFKVFKALKFLKGLGLDLDSINYALHFDLANYVLITTNKTFNWLFVLFNSFYTKFVVKF